MKGKQLLCAMALLGGIALMSASSASAQTVPLPNAYTFLGMVGNQAKLVSQDPNNPAICATRNVGGIGGLNAPTTIFGTSQLDVIALISTTTTHCGMTINPLITNGNAITIRAAGQADWIDAGGFAGVTLVGDAGNDIIVHSSSGGALWGTGDNDLMIAGPNNSFFGENGNDTMCAGGPTSPAVTFNGGFGSDTHCGVSFLVSSSTFNCGPC